MVPLGHHLIVRKTVPFGAPFWCHFPKGPCFSLHFLSGGTTLQCSSKETQLWIKNFSWPPWMRGLNFVHSSTYSRQFQNCLPFLEEISALLWIPWSPGRREVNFDCAQLLGRRLCNPYIQNVGIVSFHHTHWLHFPSAVLTSRQLSTLTKIKP